MLRKLLSQTALYGLAAILPRVLNYLLVPLQTSVLDTDEYGIISEFYTYAVFFNVLYLYGMETAFFRFVNQEKLPVGQVSGTAFSALAVSSGILSGVLALLAEPLAALLGYAGEGMYVRWFAALLAIDTLAAIPFARLRALGKPLPFALLRVGAVILNIGFNLLFFWLCPAVLTHGLMPELAPLLASWYDPALGLGYAFLANLLSNGLMLLGLVPWMRDLRPGWDRVLLGRMLRYGLPVMWGGLAFAVNEASDRLLLRWWLPEGFYPGQRAQDAVGIYAACYKLSIFITLAVQAYKYAAEPFFFERAKDKQSPVLFARANHYFVLACLVMFVAVSLHADWLSLLFLRQESYRQGLAVVPVLLLANVFLGVYYNLSVWYKVTDNTRYGAYLGLGGAVVTLLANLTLIPIWGYMGSAWATLLCYGSMMTACYFWGQRHWPVPYRVSEGLGYTLAAVAVVGLGLGSKMADFWVNILWQSALTMGFAGLIWWRERSGLVG